MIHQPLELSPDEIDDLVYICRVHRLHFSSYYPSEDGNSGEEAVKRRLAVCDKLIHAALPTIDA